MERNSSKKANEGESGTGTDGGGDRIMVEDAFKNLEVPSWRNQITFRALFTSFVLSIVFNFIVCKLNLTTGVIPSLNVAAGLLGFAILKGYTSILEQLGLMKQPFTRQENTVIQTCVVASSGIAFSSKCSVSSSIYSRFGLYMSRILIRVHRLRAILQDYLVVFLFLYIYSCYLSRFLEYVDD